MSTENQLSTQEQIQELKSQIRALEKMAFPLYRGRIIQFFQGKKANMPVLKVGQPAFCTDTNEFYIGGEDGQGNQKVLMASEQGTVSVEDGSITFAKLDTVLQNQINSFITLNDIPIVSSSEDGLMSIALKTKLDGIEEGANKTTVINNMTSIDPLAAASAYQIKLLKDQVDAIDTSGGGISNIYQDNVTTGVSGTAFGQNTIASGNGSFVAGADSVASGGISVAMGADCKAEGSFSVAMGVNTIAKWIGSVAMGYQCKSEGFNALAMGNDSIANVYSSTALGSYNKALSGNASTFFTTSDALVIGNGTSDTDRSNAFRVKFNGSVYGLSAFNSSGADYAEYFEWQDSNPNNEDRVGYFVTLNGDKIEIANSTSDYIIGVISANPSIIGDSHQDQWQGIYVRDEWGRIQNEYIDVKYEDFDNDGKPIIKTRQDYVPKLNPDFNNDEEYIGREARQEWDAVGMLGKLLVRDDGTCEVNGYAKVSENGIATTSDNGYRVIKRVDKNIVQIIFK